MSAALNMEQDAAYFLDLQTHTGWGQVLAGFAEWCLCSENNQLPSTYTRLPQPCALDIGCGPGLLPALFSRRGLRAVGMDLDSAMFQPAPLHSQTLLADGLRLPFTRASFDLVTASNFLFLTHDPLAALSEMRRVLRPGGQVCLLNPSEKMSVSAAQALAQKRGLSGLALETLLNWAQRAESHWRWDEAQLQALLAGAGLCLQRSELRIGPGLARLACAAYA